MPARLVMLVIVLLGWTVRVGHGQSTASLLVNGSFEQGPAVGAFLNLAAGNKSLPGWIVTGEGVDYVSTGYWISSDGTRAIDLDGSARSRQTPPYVQGGIAQTFATIPGMQYRVTFDLAGNPNQLPEIKRFQISAAGQSAHLSFNAKGKNARDMGWQATTWTFTASEVATTLEFKSLTTSPQTGFGAAIDNVSVVPDKAPALQVRESATEIQVQLDPKFCSTPENSISSLPPPARLQNWLRCWRSIPLPPSSLKVIPTAWDRPNPTSCFRKIVPAPSGNGWSQMESPPLESPPKALGLRRRLRPMKRRKGVRRTDASTCVCRSESGAAGEEIATRPFDHTSRRSLPTITVPRKCRRTEGCRLNHIVV